MKGTRQKGSRLGVWLTLDQAHALLRAPSGDGLRPKRDRALLALLIGCGLGGAKSRIWRWTASSSARAAGCWWTTGRPTRITEGRLFRAISQKGAVGEALTAQAVYLIVKGYAGGLGLPVAPHDLRRTFAKLAHQGRSPVEQIQLSLGHESILTTERYLGVRQSLTDAPCDHLGIELKQN